MNRSNEGSYLLDQFSCRIQEKKRLAYRAHFQIEDFIFELQAAGLKKNMSVLEIGSGTGHRSIHLAKFLKTGELLAIDKSTGLLKGARALKKKVAPNLSNLRFEQKDINEMKVAQAKFDFVYMRLVLQHLPHPLNALKNIGLLLRPGGILFIEETDRGWMGIYPSTHSWSCSYQNIIESQIKNGGDPFSGRKLSAYFRKSGFKNIQIKMKPVYGDHKFIQKWLVYFAPSYLNLLGGVKLKKAVLALTELKNLNKKKALSIYQVWFQGIGVKP